jgi:hypothetical protein
MLSYQFIHNDGVNLAHGEDAAAFDVKERWSDVRLVLGSPFSHIRLWQISFLTFSPRHCA